ncbi:MAG: hypothetical protein HC769_33515 [Cyanobacteria bacterium CRU_2_1]|nr:hypothetical protein [Cyanobacteria bacterium CRU_2_1]
MIKENTQLDQALYQDAKEIFEIRFSEMLRTLVEKYGTPDELKSFDPQQPIATERLFTLLDKHYQQRYIESHNITANSYTYDFSQSLRGAGWQRREYPKDIPIYRWTGPSTASTLDLPVRVDKDTDFVIELRLICIQVVPLDILDSLWLEVNGHPVKLHILLSDQGTQFRQGFIPAKVLDPNHPLIECTFRVNRVSPLNANNPRDPDKRQVGVAFTFVQAFPANVLRQCSTLAPFFKCPKWIEAIDFLREQMKPEETLASSIVFKSQLPATEICEYDSFLTKGELNGSFFTKERMFSWVLCQWG